MATKESFKRMLFPTCDVEHNPKPSTPRGHRRHEKRDENQKAKAASTWGTNPPRTYKEKKSRENVVSAEE